MRIGFAGSGRFAEQIWRALVGANQLPVLLLTAPPSARDRGLRKTSQPLVNLAEAVGTGILAPLEWDAATLRQIDSVELDCLVVADYGRRLPVAELPPAVNVHPSLLPRWRGAAPIQRTLWYGDRYAGVSVMQVVEAIDAGPLYAQQATPVLAGEDAGRLGDRLAQLGAEHLLEVLGGLTAGRARVVVQDVKGVSWAKRLTAKEEWLTAEEMSTSTVLRRVRALSPRPAAKISIEGRPLQLLQAEATAQRPPAGRLRLIGGELVLGTRDGGVRLLRVRPAGGREMGGADFWRGLRGGGR